MPAKQPLPSTKQPRPSEKPAQLRGSATKRLTIMDEIRGLSILLMVGYHVIVQIVYVWGVNIPAFHYPFVFILQQLFAGVFIVISGISSQYARSNLRRGLMLVPLALAVSVVTRLATPELTILFGILHLLAVAMILYHLLRPALRHVPWQLGLVVCLVLFALTYNISAGYLGFGPLKLWLPAGWYQHYWLSIIGLVAPGFSSSDFFPVFPWLFMFLAGTFAGVYVRRGTLPAWCYRSHVPFLQFVGRHTLVIYLAHQPVVYGVLYVIFSIIRS